MSDRDLVVGQQLHLKTAVAASGTAITVTLTAATYTALGYNHFVLRSVGKYHDTLDDNPYSLKITQGGTVMEGSFTMGEGTATPVLVVQGYEGGIPFNLNGGDITFLFTLKLADTNRTGWVVGHLM